MVHFVVVNFDRRWVLNFRCRLGHVFEKDLYLTGQEFATLLSILFVRYIIMQIPS